MLLLDIAPWLFVISSIGQAVYLFVLAPRYFDVVDPPDEQGRRQTTNAFVIYVAATTLVVWAAVLDRLVSWRDVPWPPSSPRRRSPWPPIPSTCCADSIGR